MGRDLRLLFDRGEHNGNVCNPRLTNSHFYMDRHKALWNLIDELPQVEIEEPIYVMKESGLKQVDKCANGSSLNFVLAHQLGNLRYADLGQSDWNLAILTFCSQLRWNCPVYLYWH